MDTLPTPVADALAHPPRGLRVTTEAAGIRFSALHWGDERDRVLVLVHGVTASARIWWRVGPALAAGGRLVIAPDMPGHGETGGWRGHHRFRDNAADLAAWIRAAGLDRPGLQLVGHSWGAMTVAALARAGIRPASVVLLDPPAVSRARIAQMAADPSEQSYGTLPEAIERVRAANPAWTDGDVEAKAEALVQLDVKAARAILLDNGDWDGGLADLADTVAAGVRALVVRADPAAGGMLPDDRLPPFEALLGARHVVTLAGAPHAPQRTHPIETTRALLDALD